MVPDSPVSTRIDEIRQEIARIEAEGLIAATGTVIEKYVTKNKQSGRTYEYYRLCDSKGRFLVHIGNSESEWYRIFQEAVQRRNYITERKDELKLLAIAT
jgi:hypothetical protein